MDLLGRLGVPAFSDGSGPLPAQLLGLFGLLLTLGQDLGVLGRGLTVLLGATPLDGDAVTLALEHDGGHQPLDLGGLELGLLLFLALLGGNGPLDHVLADVVLLGQVVQLADLRGSLGAEAAGDGVVGKAGDLLLALLDDDDRDDGQVGVDDAAADGLAFTLALPALAEARVSLVEEEADAALGEDALLHGETLFVVSAGDAEGVALPFVAEGAAIDLLAHTLLVKGANLKRKETKCLNIGPCTHQVKKLFPLQSVSRYFSKGIKSLKMLKISVRGSKF